MADQIKLPKGISRDEFLNQIRCGTHDAVLEVIRGNDDFFAAVRDGIEAAVKASVRQREPPRDDAPA